MSVVVATAYMDEAEGFDWLAAMDDGRVIATGSPAEMRGEAGAATLEEAFIDLLPPEKRVMHQEVVVRPRSIADDDISAIEAEGLTRRFGKFVAVDQVSFRIGRGEIFGFRGSNGCGKSTIDEDADRAAAGERRLGQAFRPADSGRRHRDAARCRAYVTELLAL